MSEQIAPAFEYTALEEAEGWTPSGSLYDAEAQVPSRGRLRDRLGRVVMNGLVALGIVSGAVALEASPAQAETPIYDANPDATAGGVFARTGPHIDDTTSTPGDGIYPGDQVRLECGVTNGDPVGEHSNTTWHRITDLTRPSLGTFWVNDHDLLTPNPSSQLAPGEADCNAGTQLSEATISGNTLQPAESIRPFISFDRTAAVNWALDNARNTPPDAGSCTWFVSQALRAGGLPETSTWNLGFIGLRRDLSVRDGTDAARKTPEFMEYMGSLPYVKVEPLGQLKTGINDIVDAKLGDVIIYDWTNDGYVDHADVVTGTAANNVRYPLVSGWSEKGADAVSYKQRGWTWSEKEKTYLQTETDEQGNHPNENMSAYIIHIITEDEVLR